jgi:hypothetical protein
LSDKVEDKMEVLEKIKEKISRKKKGKIQNAEYRRQKTKKSDP